jgi:hypothetical protein
MRDAQEANMTRYLAPIVGNSSNPSHLVAACQLAARDEGQVVALLIGLVPSSLPMGSDVPELWSRLEYEAARARRLGRELGQEIETVLALSDSAGEAVIRLVDECRAGAVCLAYEPGLRGAFRRWRDPLWSTVLERSPCPVVLERVRAVQTPPPAEQEPARARPLAVRH